MMGHTGEMAMMGGAGWGVFGGTLMLLFWVFMIAGFVWLVLTITRDQGRARHGGAALGILAERLARGEIDPTEYRLRRAAIEEGAK